jgi:DNA methylase
MFPEEFVAKQLLAYSNRGDTVFDPFCGRGTAVFESLLNGRQACGTDINPVAACVAGAKSDPPTLRAVLARLDELGDAFDQTRPLDPHLSFFFSVCFHPRTLAQILFLRSNLCWKTSRVDRFISAVTLGCLHGESHKSPNCLSNRMPRTVSTKPDYSVRWWAANKCEAPERDALAVLRNLCKFRLSEISVPLRGIVKLRDARRAGRSFPKLAGKVKLLVTSPYLDTTDYQEDQWLRLWFLGGPEHPARSKSSDDRHTSALKYWEFLTEAWRGCFPLLHPKSVVVVRIGGTKLAKEELFAGLQNSLVLALPEFRIRPIHPGLTTEIKNRQTNSFRPGTRSRRFEHDFAFDLFRRYGEVARASSSQN